MYFHMVRNPKNNRETNKKLGWTSCDSAIPDTLQITATENMGQWLFNKFGTPDGHVAFEEVFGKKCLFS